MLVANSEATSSTRRNFMLVQKLERHAVMKIEKGDWLLGDTIYDTCQ